MTWLISCPLTRAAPNIQENVEEWEVIVAVGDGDSEHAMPFSVMAKVAEPCLLTAHTEACKSWKWHLYIHVLGH